MSEQNDLAAADQAIFRIAKERGWPEELARRMIGDADRSSAETRAGNGSLAAGAGHARSALDLEGSRDCAALH